MALQSSGAISFNNINVELGVAGTTSASLNQASYRTLAGVASGAISLSNFYGKSNAPAGTTYSFTYTYIYESDREGGSETHLLYNNYNSAESRLVNGANILAVGQSFDNVRTEFGFTVILAGHRASANFFTSVSGNGRTLTTSSVSSFYNTAYVYDTTIGGNVPATYWSWYSVPGGGAGNVLLPYVAYSTGTTTNNLTFA
jgi:hypothetical protein